ncbi:hypothetical protein PAPYR_13482 [Paratrimastix pyriformis]|uniref:Uncharacterized protein n=1 Tax=Paratrimastix pyriformis TaxID=342808 RepID=A0ABQ8U4A8_9EUKA|nr:hypothetical protein PAPYR_13482 [Paratrimastix pyriformis]
MFRSILLFVAISGTLAAPIINQLWEKSGDKAGYWRTELDPEFRVANGSLTRSWKVNLGYGYPAMDQPVAVAASAPVVAALIGDDRVQENRTACLYLFTLTSETATPKPLVQCFDGLLFEDPTKRRGGSGAWLLDVRPGL